MLAAGLTFRANTSGALNCTLASGPTGSPGPVFTGGTMQFAGAEYRQRTADHPASRGRHLRHQRQQCDTLGRDQRARRPDQDRRRHADALGSGTYTGATAVNVGTLQAGAVNAFSPFSAFTVASGATLDLNSFNQSIGSLAGAGGVTLGSAILTTGNDNTSTIFSGSIAGTGGLTKIGAGTFMLTGASTYTGPTNVNAGILSVNGSLASTVFVNSGGTLMGNGSVGGLNVVSGGTAAPGNSIGTLNVAGNVNFGPGSIYQVETNAAGQSDKILAGGTSSLTGGTVQVLAENGNLCAPDAIHDPDCERRRHRHVRECHQQPGLPHSDAELRPERRVSDAQPQRHHLRIGRADAQPAQRRRRLGSKPAV